MITTLAPYRRLKVTWTLMLTPILSLTRKLTLTLVVAYWVCRNRSILLTNLGKEDKTPLQRQKGRRCEMEVVPFGDVHVPHTRGSE